MNQSIWKYKIATDSTHISVPKDAKFLTVQAQQGKICVWFIVDPLATEREVWQFDVIGTGGELDFKMHPYLGTIQLLNGKFVGHVFGGKL